MPPVASCQLQGERTRSSPLSVTKAHALHAARLLTSEPALQKSLLILLFGETQYFLASVLNENKRSGGLALNPQDETLL